MNETHVMPVGLPVIPHQDLMGTSNNSPHPFDLAEDLDTFLISENPQTLKKINKIKIFSLYCKFACKTNTGGKAPGPFPSLFQLVPKISTSATSTPYLRV